MNPTHYLVLAAALFTIGAVGVLVRRNAIVVFMCVELMLNAANLTLVTFSRVNGNLDGQMIAFFVMVVAAAEVVIGLAIIMAIFRSRNSSSIDDVNLLKYLCCPAWSLVCPYLLVPFTAAVTRGAVTCPSRRPVRRTGQRKPSTAARPAQ